jgi:hypothetical protein
MEKEMKSLCLQYSASKDSVCYFCPTCSLAARSVRHLFLLKDYKAGKKLSSVLSNC